jgi:hypothetical protein
VMALNLTAHNRKPIQSLRRLGSQAVRCDDRKNELDTRDRNLCTCGHFLSTSRFVYEKVLEPNIDGHHSINLEAPDRRNCLGNSPFFENSLRRTIALLFGEVIKRRKKRGRRSPSSSQKRAKNHFRFTGSL